MIVTTSALYKLAYSRYAIGAYNINNLEQTLGLFKGCIDSQAPFIIQLSKGSRKYADKRMLERSSGRRVRFILKPSLRCTWITGMKRPVMTVLIPAFTVR